MAEQVCFRVRERRQGGRVKGHCPLWPGRRKYPHVSALYRLLLVGSADGGGSVFSILCVVLSIPWALDLEMERVSSGNEIF